MSLIHLTDIHSTITPENAQLMEDGTAEVVIKPVHGYLVVFVNEQQVYAPIANNMLETYTNCCEEIQRYMNAY